MEWPTCWCTIENASEAAAFQEELQREMTASHPLLGLPLRAIGRRWDSNDVLFAVEDGSGRVAMVLLPWTRRPAGAFLSFPTPTTSIYESLDVWSRKVEWAMTLRWLKPDSDVKPKLKQGDRVLMLKHADWKGDARGTIVSEGRPRIVYDGSTKVEYNIEFDEPQTDLTDESIEYEGTSVLEEYLRVTGGDQTRIAVP